MTNTSGKNIACILARYKVQIVSFSMIFFAVNKCAYHYHASEQTGMEKFVDGLNGLANLFSSPFLSFSPRDLTVAFLVATALQAYLYIKKKNQKATRKEQEYGSAAWATEKDGLHYQDPDPQKNILLTATEGITMGKSKDFSYERNKNVLVVGGSGSGKTRFFVKPNLMQLHSSYVITDPKGTLIEDCGKLLQDAGYRIKIFNTVNFNRSMHYNPFAYVHSEADILKLVNTLIMNTKAQGKTGGDEFWENAERLYYCALIGLIMEVFPKEEQNFTTLLNLINASEVREGDESFKNAVDLLFEAYETGTEPEYKTDENGELQIIYDPKTNKPIMRQVSEPHPDSFCVRQYKKYKLAAGVIELRRTLNHYFSEICTS